MKTQSAAFSVTVGMLWMLSAVSFSTPAHAQNFSVAGCNINVTDLSGTVNCIQNAMTRAVNDARKVLQDRLDDANDEIRKVQRTAAIEAAKAEAQARLAQRQIENLQRQVSEEINRAQLGWQSTLLAEIKNQEALFNCLANSGNFDIAQAINQFRSNPSAYTQQQALNAIRTLSATIPTALQAEIGSLRNGIAIGGDRSIVVRRAMDAMFRVVSQVPGGQCLAQSVTPQQRALLENAVGGIVAETERQARTIAQQHVIPAIQSGLARQIRAGLDSIVRTVPASVVESANSALTSRVPFLQGLTLSEREMRAIARGVLADRQTRLLGPVTKQLSELNTLAASGTSTSAILDDARRRLDGALTGTPDYDQLALQIGVELLRAVAHKYVDSDRTGHGGYILNQGYSLLQTGADTAVNTIDGLCGLIPEAGAIVCAVIMEGVIATWNIAILPALQGEVQGLVHTGVDAAFDKVLVELSRGVSLADIHTRLGPLDALVAAIPAENLLRAWAYGYLQQDINALNGLLTQVGALANHTTAAR